MRVVRPLRPASAGLLLLGAVCVGRPAPLHAQLPDSVSVDTIPVLEPPSADSAGFLSSDSMLPPSLPPEVIADLYAMTHSAADTPFGMGLIPTGLVEARIAEAYARIAGQDSADVRAMKSTMTDVVHALDPEEAPYGRGLGYGFKRATEGVRARIDIAAAHPESSPALRYHAPFVRDAAANALLLADEAVALARSIGSSDEAEPAPLLERLEELVELVRAMAYGADRDRDGRIGNYAAESGLAKAGYHLELLRRVERLDTVPLLPDSLPIPVVVRDTTDVGGR